MVEAFNCIINIIFFWRNMFDMWFNESNLPEYLSKKKTLMQIK